MPGSCLSPSPRISLTLVGSPGALQADVIHSSFAGNGLANMADGLYAPGYDDLLGTGFYAIPGTHPIDLLARVAPIANYTWTFRYNGLSTSTNVWEFIGGAAAYVEANGASTITPSTSGFGSWQNTASNDGPVFVAPFNGTYLVEFGAAINGWDNTHVGEVGISVGGGTPSDTDTAASPSTNPTSVMRALTFLANSGDEFRMKYRGQADGTPRTFTYNRRWIKVTPIRVSGARAGGTYPGT